MQEKIDLLNEKLEKDTFDKPDCPDFENNFSKVLTKKCKVPLMNLQCINLLYFK